MTKDDTGTRDAVAPRLGTLTADWVLFIAFELWNSGHSAIFTRRTWVGSLDKVNIPYAVCMSDCGRFSEILQFRIMLQISPASPRPHRVCM